MNEGDFFCNAKHCHDLLTSTAWVTSCSHIFCDQDGQKHLNQVASLCPACGATLTLKGSVKRVDMDPSDQLKNMMLAGFKPDVIMDICGRGLGFWTYQMDKERQRQLQKVELLRSQMLDLEKYYERILNENNAEILNIKRQLQSSKKKIATVVEQKDSLSIKLDEKNRQYQKLQNLYDSIRRHPGSSFHSRHLSRPIDEVPSHSQNPSSHFKASTQPPLGSSYCGDSILHPFNTNSLPSNFERNNEVGNPFDYGRSTSHEEEIAYTRTKNFEFFPVTSSALGARGIFRMTNTSGHNGAKGTRQDP